MELIKALNKQTTNRVPVWLMRQAGRYLPEYRELRKQAGSFLDLCYSPKRACEVTLQPLNRFDLDAAIIFSDILVVPHAMGQNVWFQEGEGPRLNPITSIVNLPDFDKNQFLENLSPVFEALELARSTLADDKALIGFSGAPWTLACYMINGRGSRDYQNVRIFARQNPKEFQDIIDALVTAISIYLIQKIKSGANAIQIFDSWSGVLSVEEFRNYSITPTQKIIKNVKEIYPNIPIIGFPRGAGLNYRDYISGTGIDGVSCDQYVPLSSMVEFQEKVTVQGNLDNVLLLHGGDKMIEQANKICKTLANGPFIFNLGHGVIKETNPDTVTQLIEEIRKC